MKPELELAKKAAEYFQKIAQQTGDLFLRETEELSQLITRLRGTESSLRENEEKKKFRVLHVSTDEVFGSLGPTGQFTESTAYDPRSPYSASKASSDHLVRAWIHTFRLPAIITNCSNNYGPYQFPEKLIPVVILNAMKEAKIPVYGSGDNVRDWIYVEDHVKSLFEVLTNGKVGETYNIGGKTEKTNLDIVTSLCEILDS